jgi:cell volume regulation protein A
MIAIEHLMLLVALLLGLSILASQLSLRLSVPALLLFLGIGMLAGSDGPGGIYFDDARLSQMLGVVALTFILFSGGLDTHWQSIRPVLVPGISLSTLGIVITALVVGVIADQFLGFTLLEGMLLGAIVASTDAPAVFGLLRARSMGLKGRLKPLIEFESGSNDPMAVLLTFGLIALIVNPATTALDLSGLFIRQLALGGLIGAAMGWLAARLINGLRLGYDGLYPVLTIATVLLTYGAAAALGGSGFLAVYLAGLVLGNQSFIHRRSLMQFHDGLAWLMQIGMFLILGLLVFPSQLPGVAGDGLLIAFALAFIARPLAVFLSLGWMRFNWRERLLLSWVGLRGASPIILATFPLLAGTPEASRIFNIVFFVVLISVLLQGVTIARLARWLRLYEDQVPRPDYPIQFIDSGDMKSELSEIIVPPGGVGVGKQIVELSLPEDALVVLIARGSGFIVPRGGTVIEAGDRLLVLASPPALEQACVCLITPITPQL